VTISSSSVSSASPLGDVLDKQRSDLDEKAAHTPALPTLRVQQQELRERLRDGLEDRRAILMWSHAAAAVAVGQVPDGWFGDLVNDRWTVAACLADESKRVGLCGRNSPDDEQAASVRMDIIQNTLSPAFQSALGTVRERAGDVTTDRDGVKHMDRQRFLALRPRLHQVAVAQHKALRQAFGAGDWDPLDSREAVIEWCDYVGYSCAGFLERDFTTRVASPMGQWWGSLTEDRGAELESLLAAEVLPAMNAALRVSGAESDEMAARSHFDSDGGNIS